MSALTTVPDLVAAGLADAADTAGEEIEGAVTEGAADVEAALGARGDGLPGIHSLADGERPRPDIGGARQALHHRGRK